VNHNGNGHKPNVIPDASTSERGAERGELGRYRSVESRNRALSNLRPANSERARELGSISGNVRHQQAEFSRLLDQMLSRRFPGDKEHRTFKQALAEVLIGRAIAGDMQACKILLDRWAGPLPDFEDSFTPERVQVVVNLNVPRYPPIAGQLSQPKTIDAK